MNLVFVFVGGFATLLGLALLWGGVRGHAGGTPKATAKLIGGMMLAAFGILLAGFSIGYSNAEPLEIAR